MKQVIYCFLQRFRDSSEELDSKIVSLIVYLRDVTTGATGATEVAPKFSDTLTLSQPRGADSAHHYRGRS